MGKAFKQYAANVSGRDFIVGDIHGYFYVLEALLTHVGFETNRDRLFCVGDLIDRGPESERLSEFLTQPWLHAIRGNHEQMLIRGAHTVEWAPVDMAATQAWLSNVGSWFFQMSLPDQGAAYCDVQMLPFAMEIALPDGRTAGIVHGDVLEGSWTAVRRLLTEPNPQLVQQVEALVWGRSRAFAAKDAVWGKRRVSADTVSVTGADVVFFGHTPMPAPVSLANTRWLDTGVSQQRALSLAELGVDGRVWSLSVDCRTLSEGWTRPPGEAPP